MVRMKAIYFFLLFGLYGVRCSGQTGDLIFHHLHLQNGLSQATNAFIYKDSRGFVWISSVTGLNRFDGTHVQVYSPDRSDPSSMLGENIQSPFFEDRHQDIWFNTYEAIQRYQWDTDCFDHYQLTDAEGKVRIGYYIFYLDPDERLWFLIERQELYTFHIPSGKFEFKGKVVPNTVRCYVATETGGHIREIYLRGLARAGIEVLKVDASGQIKPAQLLGTSVDLHVRNIGKVLAEQDAIWILTPSALIRMDRHTHKESIYPVEDAEDMVRVSDTLLLVGSKSAGLKWFDTRSGKWSGTQIRDAASPTGLKSSRINYLHIDHDKTIWVSSVGLGVSYAHIDKRKFQTLLFPEGKNRDDKVIPVNLLEDRNGRLWCFSQDDGVMEVRRPGELVGTGLFRNPGGNPVEDVYEVHYDPNGWYWIAAWSGIQIYNPLHDTFVSVRSDSLVGFSFQHLPDGRLLVSTNKGVFESITFEEGGIGLRLVEAIPSDKEYFPILLDHKRRLWLNRDVQMFLVLDPATYQVLDSVPVLGFSYSMALSPDSTVIWIAATTGLYEIDAGTLDLRRVHNDRSGLPAVGFSSMLQDDSGKLWLSHSGGIIAFDPTTGYIRSYNEMDGLPPLQFTKVAHRMKDGEMWFGAVGGLTRFYPDQVRDVQTPAIPQITSIWINDKPPARPLACDLTAATHITEIQKLTLPYSSNTLTLAVSALEYSAPELNSLLYKLEGLDDDLIRAANGSEIRYPNLPAGHYRLLLYGVNSDGIRNPVPRILQIHIRPPFYQTWWFISISALLIIGIIAYIFYLRFSKALELQQVRLKLYENLHDDVGSRLTAIVLSAEDLERNERITHPKITAMAQIARSIVGNMRRLVWAIDPENDRMQSILQKIQHDRSMLLDDQIRFDLDMDPGLRNLVLPGEIRYQMSSISNEAFNNIAKYAQASHVSMSIRRQDGHIVMTIRDNGKGFSPEDVSRNALTGSGYGLANMKRRASRVGGRLIIDSKPGTGTTIEFTFPVRR